jgi:hypothetical protein
MLILIDFLVAEIHITTPTQSPRSYSVEVYDEK